MKLILIILVTWLMFKPMARVALVLSGASAALRRPCDAWIKFAGAALGDAPARGESTLADDQLNR
jgi:hypothetical protein